LVVWTQQMDPENPDHSWQVVITHFQGNTPGDVIHVNPNLEHNQTAVSVTMIGSHEALVTWTEEDTDGQRSLMMQRYDQNGDALMSVPKPITTGASVANLVTVPATNGTMLAAWTNVDPDTEQRAIYMQRFDANGDPIG